MTAAEKKKIIQKLKDDRHYYGDFGKQFFSNSEIVKLVKEPDQYGKDTEKTLDMLKGSYLHTRILQPERIGEFEILDVPTRNNKEYRDMVAFHSEGNQTALFLLQKEVMELEFLASRVMNNAEFRKYLIEDVQEDEIEQPGIADIMGYRFKGKADRINNKLGKIPDLKTTRNLESFRDSFWRYGYHSQSYLYREIFGLPVVLFVVSKEDGRLGIYDICDETLEQGRQFVQRGLERYEMYYGDNATADIEQYFDYNVL